MKPINKPKEGDALFFLEFDSIGLHVHGKDEEAAKTTFIKYLTIKKSKQHLVTVRRISK